MADNLFETQYDLTKKSKFKEFYEKNKIFIYLFIFLLVTILFVTNYYLQSIEKKKILLSDNYVAAKINLAEGNRKEAEKILRNIIFEDDPTYSTLSFLMILDEKLIDNKNEIFELFDHLLKKNKFDREIKNLLIYKKALYSSNFVEEAKLLNDVKPLLNQEESLWKGYALLLVADYYFSKKEFLKSKDFYKQILSTENLETEMYYQAKLKLELIENAK